MTRGGGKRTAIGVALLIIALAGVAALASFDSSPISGSLAAAQTTTDYDTDDDGLIEVSSLAQLNAIRWDLNGNGAPDSMTNAASYGTAFPNRDTAAATRMGCPETSVPADTTADCIGYELAETNAGYLDFDTDGDGDVDSSDSPSFPNWTPIGATATGTSDANYTGEFKGNNRTISNLTINNTVNSRVGLFRGTSSTAKISGVGLVNASVATTATYAGALVGLASGEVISCYSTGSISSTSTNIFNSTGGLIGYVDGTVSASWSSVNVSAAGTGNYGYSGGLAGLVQGSTASITASYATGAVSSTGNNANIGGLVGFQGDNSSVSASYATGPATATGTSSSAGGVRAGVGENATISASYWDVGTTGIADDADGDAPEGVTTSDLQSLTSYTGIFATWNANLDGVAGNDDPWEFGQAMQYPRLKYESMNQVAQGSLVMGTPGTNNDNPVVGQVARVCLLAGPTQRAAGTGGATYQPWQWYRSTDGASWGSPITKTGPTYDYTPVAGDVGNYLRACVDVRSALNVDRVLGDDRVCVGPFAKVQASGGS